MIKKVSEAVLVSLVVTNGSEPVTSDTPTLTFVNPDTRQYYNGLTWQNTEFKFTLSHVANGVYTWQSPLFFEGMFVLSAASTMYPEITTIVRLDVVSDQIPIYYSVINKPYQILYTKVTDVNVDMVICKEADKTYLDAGGVWNNELVSFSMPETIDNVFEYDFVPTDIGKYLIGCDYASGTSVTQYILTVYNSESEITPVDVTSDTIKSLDGTTSELLDDKLQTPIAEALISAYSVETRSLVNSCYSTSDGTWKMVLRPGRYIFTFEKDGYDKISFERNVM